MLEIYLSSVIIYMIIIYCVTKLSKPYLIANGWHNTNVKKTNSVLCSLFIIAAVPLIRLFVIGGILYMTTITKEDYERIKKEHEDE